jgi:hypothetical protein
MKQETLEEVAERLSELQEGTYTIEHKTTYKHGFQDGAKWQQERMYSEEDLEEAAERIISNMGWVWENTESSARMVARHCAKWQQEQMYSEEDLREAFKGGGKMSWTDINQETQEPYYYDFNEWLKQFKKN